MKRFIVCIILCVLMLSACTNPPAETEINTEAPTTTVAAVIDTTFEPIAETTVQEIKTMDKLKVVTYNIQTQNGNSTPLSKRSTWLKTIVSEYDPDVMGFQEVTPEWLKYLQRKFTEYSYVGEPRTGGANPGEYSPVFYKTDKFELLETKTFWLSETPDVESYGWDAAYPRVCTYAVLKDKETGTIIVHMNTHIDHKGANAKTNQIQMLVDYAKEHFSDSYVVLTGDFNVKQDTKNYNIAVTDTIFADTKKTATKTENFASFIKSYNEANDAPPIDFIFYNKSTFTADTYHVIMDKVDDQYPSDHFGLYGELSLIHE